VLARDDEDYGAPLGDRVVRHRRDRPLAGYLPSGELIPGVSGPLHFGLNCNLNAKYQGLCWGTFETSVGEGSWSGAWSGEFDLGATPQVAQVSITARGHGAFAGRVLKLDATGPAKDGDFYFLAEIVGR
jgi:hypothetical protein